MTQKKIRILLAEDNCAETMETLNALFPDATGGLELTVVFTMATLIPTAKTVDPELSLSDPLDAVHLVHRSAPGITLVVLADPAKKQYAAQSRNPDGRSVVRAETSHFDELHCMVGLYQQTG